MAPTPLSEWVLVTPEALSLDEVVAWVTRANCGAVVTFSGVVRDHSRSRENVTALEYEADIDLAERRMREIVAEARTRWPAVEAIAVHHRVGMVALSEPTVVVAVSSPHRDDAFEAARYCIDTLKRSVPMWKREFWPGGSAWSEETSPLLDVGDP
ncbi:MAG: molybdenum cofactor biosynthesis protein MoaE [Acidimicrobiales bacterium]